MPYDDLEFPEPAADRPYIYINMVSTIDGKTILGERNESVVGLGSKEDQATMDKLERAADAVLLGAGSIRANPLSWNPHTKIRIGVTGSGNVPWDCAFFAGGEAYVLRPRSASYEVPSHVQTLEFGEDQIDWAQFLIHLHREMGLQKLHVLGGSELNAQLLAQDLADELFLTLAPKIKLGRDLPTYAGGDPLPREHVREFELLECHPLQNEVFLRYRRRR